MAGGGASNATQGATPADTLIINEAQMAYAKYGYAPLDTVKGLADLHDLLVRMYETNQTLPMATKLKYEKLAHELEVFGHIQPALLEIAKAKAETDKIRAVTEAQIKALEVDNAIYEAKVAGKEKRVKLTGRSRSADIDQRVMDTQKLAESLEKGLKANARVWRALRSQALRPALSVFLKVGIPLVVVANIIADQAQYADAPVLGAVNAFWDALYMPFRSGVIQSLSGVIQSLEQLASK